MKTITRYRAEGSMRTKAGGSIGPWSGPSVGGRYEFGWVSYKDHCNIVAELKRRLARLEKLVLSDPKGE